MDFTSGAVFTEDDYRAREPRGRAFLHPARAIPSPEAPDAEYPLVLGTGRTLHHFHTRTKTGRVPELNDAAPEPWVEVHPDDAVAAQIRDGTMVRVSSRRGSITVRARVGGVRSGTVFVPFHYGYWDLGAAGPEDGTGRAANELTATR